MQKILIFMAAGCLASLFACSHSEMNGDPVQVPVKIDTSLTAELRAVLVTLVAASKNPDASFFRQLILPREKEAFDAREWDDPGYLRRYMAAIASIKPKDYTLDLAEGRTDFYGVSKDPKSAEMQKVWVCLLRDGSSWKLTTPPPSLQRGAYAQPDTQKHSPRYSHKRPVAHSGKTR